MPYLKSGSPFLYDDVTGDMIGLRDADGGEALFLTSQATAFVQAKCSPSKSAAQNAAELAAAHADLASTGGIVEIPGGVFQVSGDIDVSNGRNEGISQQGVIFRGRGLGGTRLVMTDTSGPLFAKTAGHGHGFRDMTLYGPGTGTTAVAIDWQSVGGGGLMENVWIENFGIGSRYYDATAMSFVNVHWHANGDNVQLGYNCDLFQFYGGRIQNATGSGVLIGYYEPLHPSGALFCSPVNFNGVRFGANARALKVLDTRAEQIVFDKCYFENNTRIAVIGESGVAQSVKNLTYDHCFFTVTNAAAVQIECLADNSNASLTVRGCTQDDGAYAGTFAQVGTSSSVLWERNRFPLGGAGRHVKIGTAGVSHIIKDESTWRYNENVMDFADGALQAASVPARHMKMTNGTGKTWQKWSRNSGSTDAEVGLIQGEILDVNGQFVLYRGAVRIGTVSALPTAAVEYRGIMAYQEGAGGVADTVVTCMKAAAGTYSWKVVATG